MCYRSYTAVLCNDRYMAYKMLLSAQSLGRIGGAGKKIAKGHTICLHSNKMHLFYDASWAAIEMFTQTAHIEYAMPDEVKCR